MDADAGEAQFRQQTLGEVDDKHHDPKPDSASDRAATSGNTSGARYKLMSPAKLPISRSPILTIPPGLSPTSFLESPVLLSNMKVEPSPTTGSFPRLQQTSHGFMTSFTSAAFPVTTVCYNTNVVDDGKSSFFEFKPHNRSNMVPANFDNHACEKSTQIDGQGKVQTFVSLPLVKSEMAAPFGFRSATEQHHCALRRVSVDRDIATLPFRSRSATTTHSPTRPNNNNSASFTRP